MTYLIVFIEITYFKPVLLLYLVRTTKIRTFEAEKV